MKKIGIIGFGRFGQLISKYLAKDFKIHVYCKNNNINEIKKLNCIPSSFKDVCKNDFIIPCVPISDFKDVIKEISTHIKNGATIIDVCSVKEYPVDIMKQILPNNIDILATHPMFGPDSANDSLKNKKIVLCKVRMKKKNYNLIANYLTKKGLNIIHTSPKEHDEQIAYSQVLTHFIGRSLIDFDAQKFKIDTEGYNRLLNILDVVKNDSWQLFEDMNKYNKYSKQMRNNFIKSLNKINERVL